MQTLAFISMPGGWEWIIVGVLGLLIFGRKLPEVGRSLGAGIVEFKKGLRGLQDDIDDATEPKSKTKDADTRTQAQIDERPSWEEAEQKSVAGRATDAGSA